MIAYFDSASTSYKRPKVVYRAVGAFKKFGFNLSRGTDHKKCQQMVETTRENLKKLVGAREDYATIFSYSATFVTNQILRGLDYNQIKTIYISIFEHNAVFRTVKALAEEKNFKVKPLKYVGLKLDINAITHDFEKEKPDAVIINHVSNVCGLVQNFEAVFAEAKKYGCVNILDMAQSFGLIETNLRKQNVDVAIFAGHKTLYGFTGIGGAIVRRDLKIKDVFQGGTGHESASEKMPKQLPSKLEPGTLNILGVFSLFYSTKFLLKLGFQKIEKIERKNFERLKKILSLSKVLAPIEIENATSIVSCIPRFFAPDNFEDFFEKHKIKVRIGLQCSPCAHKMLKTFPSGTIRFSVGLFTRKCEFKRLKNAILLLNKKFEV